MRAINKEFLQTKVVTSNVIANNESINYISENKTDKVISLEVVYKRDEEIVSSEFYQINDNMYDLLMSESPPFAVGKPKNEYREIDLWHIIDLLRGELWLQ